MDIAPSRIENLPSTEPRRTEQWRLIAAGALLVGAVFSDGYAHSNFVDELDSFVTPWHGLILAGCLSCLAVLTIAVRERLNAGRRMTDAIPLGWNNAVVGVGLFALGFLGDGVWHTIYGIEADLEALLSPTHLLMLAGGLGVLTAPILADWRSIRPRKSWSELGPAIASLTLTMATISFFLNWTWPVIHGRPLQEFVDFASDQGDAEPVVLGLGQVSGLASYLIWAVVLVAPVLFFSRRWVIPKGAVVVVTVVPWVLMNAAFMSFFAWQRLVPGLVGAVIIEYAISRLRTQEAVWPWRLVGAGFPLIVFALDMVVIDLIWGLGWSPELVAGTVVAAAFVGYGISVLTHPPPVPVET